MTTPPLPVISSPRRSRLGLWLTLGGLAVLITIGTPVFLFYKLAGRFGRDYAPVAATLPAEMASAKKEGLPTTIEELRPKPPIKDTDNAAPLYRELTVLYQKQPKREEADKAFATAHFKSKRRTPKEDEEIRAFLADHAAELKLVEQAAQKPECDFARDWSLGIDTKASEYAVLRSGANLLLRAALRSDENQPVPALQDVTLAAGVANHLAHEPTLIAALVTVAIRAVAHKQFVEIVQCHGGAPAVLTAARQCETALKGSVDLQYAFKGEMVLACLLMENMRKSPESAEKLRRDGFPIPVSDPRIRQQIADAWQADLVAYYRRFQKSLRESNGDLLVFEQALKPIQEDVDRSGLKAGHEMTAILASVYVKALHKVMQNDTADHLRQEMVALLEHKQKTGRFPDTLNDLPETTAKTDPFSNQPLLYRKTHRGFVLYSVSNNRRDDGGSSKSVKMNGSSWTEDIVVSYP